LKSLIKYQLALFVTLIIACSQWFIPLTRVDHVIKLTTEEQVKSPVTNPTYDGIVYFQEERENEEDRFSRKLTELPDYTLFFNISRWELTQCPTVVSIVGHDILPTASAQFAFRVLRL